jgi:hypothetical protein
MHPKQKKQKKNKKKKPPPENLRNQRLQLKAFAVPAFTITSA